jgi:hypothetical protein
MKNFKITAVEDGKEYFVKSVFAKENILVNVVGLPMAHKGKGSN